jgi:hypothetical protein
VTDGSKAYIGIADEVLEQGTEKIKFLLLPCKGLIFQVLGASFEIAPARPA